MIAGMTTPAIGPVDFVGIPTRDLEAAVAFYGETLGLRRSVFYPERNFAEFETDNLTLSVYNPEQMGMEHNRNPNPIALHVDDVPAAREEFAARGVEFMGDARHGLLSHGVLRRPRRQRADASQPLCAARH